MLRFFRHIRQKLFLEGRVSKYLGYAVGEIALIMVGILLALQVQTWNEERKDRVFERDYVDRLIQDLQSDAETMRRAIQTGERKLKSLEAVNQALQDVSLVKENPNAAKPTLSYSYSRPSLQVTTFQELSSTGALQLIKDEGLRFHVADHYRIVQEEFARLSNRQTRLPWIVKGIFPENSRDPSRDNDAFFYMPHAEERLQRLLGYEFQELVFHELHYSEAIIDISGRILERSNELIAALEDYRVQLSN